MLGVGAPAVPRGLETVGDFTLTQKAGEIEAALLACAAGDKSALRRIYDAESPRMIGVAQRLLKRRALAEEAVQDAFVLIWRHAARFDPQRGAGLTWIYAILRNRALSILRDEKRTETSEAPLGEETASEEDDPETVMSKLSDAKGAACLPGDAAAAAARPRAARLRPGPDPWRDRRQARPADRQRQILDPALADRLKECLG